MIDHLDVLKKEAAGARDAIRWLEAEFHKGNRSVGFVEFGRGCSLLGEVCWNPLCVTLGLTGDSSRRS